MAIELNKSLLSQGLFMGTVMILTYRAMQMIPLGDASTFIYTSPLWTMFFSALFLGTRLRLYKLFFGVIVAGGIILVVKPPFIFGGSIVPSPTRMIP